MSISSLSRPISLLIAGLIIAGTPLLGTAAGTQPQADPTREAISAPPAAAKRIYEGMPAIELQALIGKPEKVVPVATKKGHAEIWVYRRLKSTVTDMVTVGTKPITVRQKQGDNWVDVVVSEDQITKNRVTETFEVAKFLIVNGQYATCSNTEEQSQYFH